jgi:hypothetical protein
MQTRAESQASFKRRWIMYINKLLFNDESEVITNPTVQLRTIEIHSFQCHPAQVASNFYSFTMMQSSVLELSLVIGTFSTATRSIRVGEPLRCLTKEAKKVVANDSPIGECELRSVKLFTQETSLKTRKNMEMNTITSGSVSCESHCHEGVKKIFTTILLSSRIVIP